MTHTILPALAFVADCYTPILLLLAIVKIVREWKGGNKSYCVRFICAAAVVYGWMYVDQYFQLWASFNLDYSTHTAAALALVVFVSLGKSNSYKWLLTGSLVTYGYLMYLLNYHSWIDMLTTILVVGLSLLPVIWFTWFKAHLSP
jgi:hypothetical protein